MTTSTKYDNLCYPHTMHRNYTRGCVECLHRTRQGQKRLTESRRRLRLANDAARLARVEESDGFPTLPFSWTEGNVVITDNECAACSSGDCAWHDTMKEEIAHGR